MGCAPLLQLLNVFSKNALKDVFRQARRTGRTGKEPLDLSLDSDQEAQQRLLSHPIDGCVRRGKDSMVE
jgi:hypothetical protein